MPTTVDTIYVPLPGKTVKEVVPVVVGTGAIIEEYFSRHVYHDTVRASAPGKLGGNAVAVKFRELRYVPMAVHPR